MSEDVGASLNWCEWGRSAAKFALPAGRSSFLTENSESGVECRGSVAQETHGAGAKQDTSVSVRRVHRNARRRVRGQKDGARRGTQLEWLQRDHRKPLSGWHHPGDKTLHRKRVLRSPSQRRLHPAESRHGADVSGDQALLPYGAEEMASGRHDDETRDERLNFLAPRFSSHLPPIFSALA